MKSLGLEMIVAKLTELEKVPSGRSDVTSLFLWVGKFFFDENEDKSGAKFMGYRCETVWCDEAISTFWQRLRNYPM